MKEENNTEKKEFPKDIDYVNPYVGLDKIYEKDPYKNLADGSKKKRRSSLLKTKTGKKQKKRMDTWHSTWYYAGRWRISVYQWKRERIIKPKVTDRQNSKYSKTG